MSIELDQIYEFAEKIRFMQERINELEAQFSSSDINNQKIYQFLSGATGQSMTLEDVTLGGDTTDSSDTTKTGTQSFEGTVEMKAAVDMEADVNFWKTDARTEGTKVDGSTITLSDVDSNTSVITRPAGATDQIEYSGNLKVVGGEFAGTTVKIGDQTIGEAGELLISDPISPGIIIRDSGDTGNNAIGKILFQDNTPSSLSWIFQNTNEQLEIYAGGNLVLESTLDIILKPAVNKHVLPTSDDAVNLGEAGTEFKDLWIDGVGYFDQLNMHGQLNLANGTIYKVEADGDAYFKFLNTSMFQWVDNQINQIATDTDSAGPLWNYDGFESGNTKFRDFYIYDGKRNLWVHCDGSHKIFKVTGTIDAISGFKDNGTAGVDGTFEDNNGNTVTVSGGIITNLTT